MGKQTLYRSFLKEAHDVEVNPEWKIHLGIYEPLMFWTPPNGVGWSEAEIDPEELVDYIIAKMEGMRTDG